MIDSTTIDYLLPIFEKKTVGHSDTQKLFFLPSFPKFYTFSCASLPKLCWSILSAAFSPWKCNPENECRETKLRDPIWSSTTSLISCTSDLWEHSWSATLWQYGGIKQMKGNSLARAEIRWAEGEWREKKNNLKSNCVKPVGSRGLQRNMFSSICRSAPSPAWCDHVNIQLVLLFPATFCLNTFIGEVTAKNK